MSYINGGLEACSQTYINDIKDSYYPWSNSPKKKPVKDNWHWHVDRIRSNDGTYVDDLPEQLYDGSGVHVYVIDTGVNYHHSDFGNCLEEPNGASRRIGEGFYSVDGSPCLPEQSTADYKCLDLQGHGTHVSSTILGAEAGIAKGATLHPVKASPSNAGYFTGDSLLAATNWVVAFHESKLSRPACYGMRLSRGGVQCHLEQLVCQCCLRQRFHGGGRGQLGCGCMQLLSCQRGGFVECDQRWRR